MASEDIGSLVVRIEANMQGFADGASKVESKLSGLKKAAVGLGVVIGAGALLGSFVKDAAEAEDNLSQLNAVLTSTGGKAGVTAKQVTDLASSLQKSTKFSDDAVIAGSNLLLTFTSIGKDVFPAATETMLNMSQALGQDVKGSAIQLGKALNDPINGVTALRRVGVSFTEAQMEQIKTLQESGDLMGAQTIILKELETEFGNAAKAAGETFSGKMERLKNQFGEIKESIGGALLPVLSNLAGWFIEKMPQIQDVVGAVMQKATWAFGDFSDSVKGFITGDMPVAFDSFYAAIEDVFGADSKTAKTIIAFLIPLEDTITKVRNLIKDAFDFITNTVLPPFIEISNYIKDEVVPLLASSFQKWMPTIINILQNLWNVTKTVMSAIVAIFEWAWPYIKTIVSGAINVLSGIISGFLVTLDGIVTTISTVVDAIKTALEWIGKLNSTSIGSKTIETDAGTVRIRGRASGGPVTGNTPYLVGEKGPELFTPSSNGNITNADKTKGLLSGQSINYENMFNGATFIVRNDNDAKMIAKEIYSLNNGTYRAAGVTV